MLVALFFGFLGLSKEIGCLDCHTKTDSATMHSKGNVSIACIDCHGGHPEIRAIGLQKKSPEWESAKNKAHILPRYPKNWPSSANPENSYTHLLREPAEFVKFINPGDIRVARETCGGCHLAEVHAVERSLMTTSAMLWGGAAYNNNILPFKKYILGESYDRDGNAREIVSSPSADAEARGALKKLMPMPQWEIFPPGDVFRIFERGGISIKPTFPEIGNPNPAEDSGRPDIRASQRGPGTGARIAVPLINIHKTRLNDPHLSLLGTNDHPGDYRSSGCSGCHVVYGNDRDKKHSGPYAAFGHEGKSQSIDPMIPKDESGHPLKHEFTKSIPTSQCMVCHMHQPNMFVNTYLGYTMWDYESDAKFMWPEKQRYPNTKEIYKSLTHNPEEAATRGRWTDKEFLKKVSELNPKLEHTQFADYHGHGWNFRAVFKKDRKGRLLDKSGKIISFDDPQKFKKAVHLADIHLEKGMHCVDCHFGQDSHGDGHLYGEVAQAVEIDCIDCHGTISKRANLMASGPAAKEGNDLSFLRTPFGEARFYWKDNKLFQRSSLTNGLQWNVKQVRDSVDPASSAYNAKSARAKMVLNSEKKIAHSNEKMTCFSCHSSWITSCAGCHLPIQANWKTESKHFDGKTTRNWASYNPQVARDDVFQLGLHGPAKNYRIAPVRSSSALVLSSTDINRQKIYIQQPPTSAAGYSSQAFAPHFPHTVRKTETKTCSDCHISKNNDNNAILTQLFLFGTNFMNFMGFYTWIATGEEGIEAVQVTEWDEPQAVIGSYLHKYAYPDFYKAHIDREKELQSSHHHHAPKGSVNTIQQRGEYLHTTAGSGGYRVYDIANIANKGFSEKIVTAPVSPLGQNTFVATKNAQSFVLPTNMPIAPFRKQLPENLETPMHPIYHYALIADSEEGLILVNVDTLQDGDPTNNFLERALTWNENKILDGARFITMAGTNVFVLTADKLIILDLDNPLKPKVMTSVAYDEPKALAVQFRYAFVVDKKGFHSLDITDIQKPIKIKSADLNLADARNIYVSRTYAYISGGREGIVILDIENPEKPKHYMTYNADGKINDSNDIKIATTNASLFAYVADGKNGLWILQLTDPERVPAFYGFSPEVKPQVIAHRRTDGPAMAISKPLDRDRAVDETGNQVSVFGRIGSRPFNRGEIERFYLTKSRKLYRVDD